MSSARIHAEWLSLIEVNGPFLTLPVLTEALPHGLEPTGPDLVADLRRAFTELGDDPSLQSLWIRWVIGTLLGFPDEVIREGAALGPSLTFRVAEQRETLRPEFAVIDDSGGSDRPRLLVTTWPLGTNLFAPPDNSSWSATPVDRLADLCRGTGVRLGLVTNADVWALVDAPVGEASATATWDASLWLEERATLDAFTTLVGVRRFFSVAADETLEALLTKSANAEAEVTDQLGKQVRQSVELLVDAMSRANRELGGDVFAALDAADLDRDVEPYVYEAAVTVLMRLVFLLSAEERGLFLLGDETYDTTYAVSTLLAELEEAANRYGEDVLERQTDAWHRLLATFRMVHAGAAHENLRIPAYGGSLFDPDRFPFLEGRLPSEPWDETPSAPLPIDNRTIMHLLDALQVLRFRGRGGVREARRLSFRSVDVEQIGHVYEGLLDHSVVRTMEVSLGFAGKAEPELALEEVEEYAARGDEELAAWLVEQVGLTAKQVERGLGVEIDGVVFDRLVSACDNDRKLADRIAAYAGLLRTDLRGLPQVFLPDSFYVTKSSDRRSSGTYYTPRALAEEMVLHTLEPLVYDPGPAQGADREQWALKSSSDILDLRVCDMAMGSGAFLVAACRYLSERVLEAWAREGIHAGDPIPLAGDATVLIPDDETDREILARRLMADRCLYGVDRNPMAVEMAKLSLWLITLAKDRPFTFVDHALRCGDSLLGITSVDQLSSFHVDPVAGRRLHGGFPLFDPGTAVEPLVKEALEKRRELESLPVLDVRDVEQKQHLFEKSSDLLDQLKVIGDLVVGALLSTATGTPERYEDRLLAISGEVISAIATEPESEDRLHRTFDLHLNAMYWLDEGRPGLAPPRNCLHWPLEFPEVFLDSSKAGFDAVIGNPPFLGGVRITELEGEHYNAVLARLNPPESKRVDICAYFFRRLVAICSPCGIGGLLATKSIAEGTTRQGGLDQLVLKGFTIVRAHKSFRWPGGAAVQAASVCLTRLEWKGPRILSGERVAEISTQLEPGSSRQPLKLTVRMAECYQGSGIWGDGFFLSEPEAEEMLAADPRNAAVIRRALGGQELNEQVEIRANRWVIDMGERELAEASSFLLPFARLDQTVRPWRSKLNPKTYKRIVDAWWRYFHGRQALYAAIERHSLESVIARCRVSDSHILALVDSRAVFMDTVVVWASDDLALFGLLQSCFHESWARRYSSTFGSGAGMRYVVGSSFATFPSPQEDSWRDLREVAERYLTEREQLRVRLQIGLKALDTAIHLETSEDSAFRGLRATIRELDLAVRDAYGWTDLRLDHGFYDVRQGVRYTIAPRVRAEALDRLLDLNSRQRADEDAQGRRATGAAERSTPQSQMSFDANA